MTKGALRYYMKRRFGNGNISILRYESISDNDVSFAVSPEEFKWHMKYLHTSGRHVVSLKKCVDDLKASLPIPKNTVVITFDEGYQDMFLYAYPILKEYNFHASVFMVADYVDQTITKEGSVFPMLKTPQLQKMDREGLVSVESMGKSHIDLTTLPLAEANLEMAEGAQAVSRHISGKCLHFAYPFGVASKEVRPVAEQLFRAAVTQKPGFVTQNDDEYELARLSVTGSTTRKQFKMLV